MDKPKFAFMLMGPQYDPNKHTAHFELESKHTYIVSVRSFEEAIEKAKSEKNNKPQDIVLEEESLDVSKETENILEVKDKLVAKDDVSKNTAIEAIEIDGNGKCL